AVHRTRPVTLLIQATTADNLAARIRKARAEPRLRVWLGQPSRAVPAWGWGVRGGAWETGGGGPGGAVPAGGLLHGAAQRGARRGRRPVQAGLFDAELLTGDGR